MLILAAIPFYILAVVATWRAAQAVRIVGGPPADSRGWLFLALLFTVMIAVRAIDGENLARDFLRTILIADGAYGSRRSIQALVAAIVGLAMLTVVALISRRRGSRRDGAHRLLHAAQMCGLAYLCLFAVRIISLHQIDALLYEGPHLNRLIDPGLALAVAVSAWRFRVLALSARDTNE